MARFDAYAFSAVNLPILLSSFGATPKLLTI